MRGNAGAGSYDAQDRIVSYGANSYAFTNNGDLSTKTNADGLTKYVIDVFGQLKSVSMPDGRMIGYLTDGQGHRFEKMVNGSIDRFFVYNELGQLVGELTSNGSLRSHFIYASQTHSPDYMIQNGVSYHFIKDHLGSIRLVVNTATGAIQQRMDYDEFGVVLVDTNPGFQPFGFAGGIYDSDSKLVRFGARDYDAEIGRWLSKDPVGFNGGDTNFYSYALQDPINNIDPDGRSIFGIGSALICGFYDVYSLYQTSQELEKYRKEILEIKAELSKLNADGNGECEKAHELSDRLTNVYKKYAIEQSEGTVKGIIISSVCAGLSKF